MHDCSEINSPRFQRFPWINKLVPINTTYTTGLKTLFLTHKLLNIIATDNHISTTICKLGYLTRTAIENYYTRFLFTVNSARK